MNSNPEDFKDLRRLLALKRHEQPPPGYFNRLSLTVAARIEAAEATQESPWWRTLFQELQPRPILVCAYGLLVCGGLLAGLGLAGIEDEDYQDLQVADTSLLFTEPVASRLSIDRSPDYFPQPIEASLLGGFNRPVTLPSRFFFDRSEARPAFQPVKFLLDPQ
jgi:hypothetical protein